MQRLMAWLMTLSLLSARSILLWVCTRRSIGAKDETISAFKSENSFLKEALISMQEVYDDDKKTIDVMREELKSAREELEFMKRKYRLMWGKVF